MRSIAVAVLAIAFMAAGAFGHSGYSNKTDPAFNNNCCGSHDCGTAPENTVLEAQNGFRVVMTLAEAKIVNPSAAVAVNAFVPHARVQPSWDGDFHVCIFPNDRTAPRGGVICFFAPMLT